MKPRELKEFRERYELTQQALADLLGITRHGVLFMEDGTRPIEKRTELALECIKHTIIAKRRRARARKATRR